MSIIEFVQRSQQLLVNPASEFEQIRDEDSSRGLLFRNFVIPWAILIGIFAIAGNSFTHAGAPLNAYFFVLLNGVLVFLIVILHTHISSRLIRLLGKNLQDNGKDSYYLKLAVYSQVPLFLILGVIKLFPSLYFLYFLALYSSLLFYAGTGHIGIEENDERVRFTLISTLLMIVSFVLTSVAFTLVYNEIVRQFSTFAAL